MSRIASVLLPMPLPEAFDYAEPEGMDLSVGDQVAAPLGSQPLVSYSGDIDWRYIDIEGEARLSPVNRG